MAKFYPEMFDGACLSEISGRVCAEWLDHSPQSRDPFWPKISLVIVRAPDGAEWSLKWSHGGEGHLEGTHTPVPRDWLEEHGALVPAAS